MTANCLEHDPNFIKEKGKEIQGIEFDDGFDRQVSALPRDIASRFGEVVFAQGGNGYGWWPCQIYDPRQAMDPAVRQMAQKYLHSRYLVYFFNCGKSDAVIRSSRSVAKAASNQGGSYSESISRDVNPFAVLPTKMIKSWLTGLSEELFLGRAAKAHGKQRYREFRDAFQMASMEYDKPKRFEHTRRILNQEQRASQNMVAEQKEPFLSPSPIQKQHSPTILGKASRAVTIKKGNRHNESVKDSDILWYQVHHDQTSLMQNDDLHPAFACLVTINETNDSNSDTHGPTNRGEVVFSCPWPPLLTNQASLCGADDKKSRTRSLTSIILSGNHKSLKRNVPSDSFCPENPRATRQRISKNPGLETVNVQETAVSSDENTKRKRGRPKKIESN